MPRAPRRCRVEEGEAGLQEAPQAGLPLHAEEAAALVDHALRDALGHPKNRLSGAPRSGRACTIPSFAASILKRRMGGRPDPPPLPLTAVLRLEAEVEAFVTSGEEGPYVFSGDMSTYEVRDGPPPGRWRLSGSSPLSLSPGRPQQH